MKAIFGNVLLVDDEASFLLSLSEGLRYHAEDLRIYLAENGKKAVDILGANSVDVVVTDLRMPEMDGFELVRFLNEKYPGLPVIVITASGRPDMEKKLTGTEIFSCLEKPLDLAELADTILAALRKSPGPGAGKMGNVLKTCCN